MKGQGRVLPSTEEAFVNRISEERSPDVQYLKARHMTEIRALVAEALASLEPRERTLLRHQYVDGLTLQQLSQLHDVHPVTVSRRLLRARRGLVAAIERRLRTQLGLSRSEGQSLIRALRSQLDLGLEHLLEPA
jgi:RNA polymerase sigma-70 factor (ECF subfamily)